jgi:hypothetical protein
MYPVAKCIGVEYVATGYIKLEVGTVRVNEVFNAVNLRFEMMTRRKITAIAVDGNVSVPL